MKKAILITLILLISMIAVAQAQEVIRLPPDLGGIDQISPNLERGDYLHENMTYTTDYADISYGEQIFSDMTYTQLNSTCLESSFNRIGIDHNICPELDTNATVTFYNTGITERAVIRKVGSFSILEDINSALVNLGGDTWRFLVDGFSQYLIAQDDFNGTGYNISFQAGTGLLTDSFSILSLNFDNNMSNGDGTFNDRSFSQFEGKFKGLISSTEWSENGGYNSSTGTVLFNGTDGEIFARNQDDNIIFTGSADMNLQFVINQTESIDLQNYTIMVSMNESNSTEGFKFYMVNRSTEGNPSNTMNIEYTESGGTKEILTIQQDNLVNESYLWSFYRNVEVPTTINYTRTTLTGSEAGKRINGSISYNTTIFGRSYKNIFIGANPDDIGGGTFTQRFAGYIEYIRIDLKNYTHTQTTQEYLIDNFQESARSYEHSEYVSEVANISEVNPNATKTVWETINFTYYEFAENFSVEAAPVKNFGIEARTDSCDNISSANYILNDVVVLTTSANSSNFFADFNTTITTGNCIQYRTYINKTSGYDTTNSVVIENITLEGQQYAPPLVGVPVLSPTSVTPGNNITITVNITLQGEDEISVQGWFYYTANDSLLVFPIVGGTNNTGELNFSINSSDITDSGEVYAQVLGRVLDDTTVLTFSSSSNNVTITAPSAGTPTTGGGGATPVNATEEEEEVQVPEEVELTLVEKVKESVNKAVEEVKEAVVVVKNFITEQLLAIFIVLLILLVIGYIYMTMKEEDGEIF